MLDQIYRRFGYFSERLENYARPGKAGQQDIAKMMRALRQRPPQEVAGLKVTRIVDRLTEEVRDATGRVLGPLEPIKDPATGEVFSQLQLAKDNLLIFHLDGNAVADGGKVAVRPSGTEPKCKFYISAHRRIPEDASDEAMEQARQQVDALGQALGLDIVKKATEGI